MKSLSYASLSPSEKHAVQRARKEFGATRDEILEMISSGLLFWNRSRDELLEGPPQFSLLPSWSS